MFRFVCANAIDINRPLKTDDVNSYNAHYKRNAC